MLNPRSFLEDTMRHGLVQYWTSGMPWELINQALGSDLQYKVSPDTKAAWVALTGLNWENQDDPMTKRLKCPYCPAWYDVPWTTCGVGEDANLTR
jgi:hypothetical protein